MKTSAPGDHVGQRPGAALPVGDAGDLLLGGVHLLRAALVDRACAVADDDIAGAEREQQLRDRDAGRARRR